ncbi:MAG TPA: ABC transporter permease [Longimicrobiales bacterium]|nr:ABC transporter permease [Longimicrobiales bacterium]
MSGTTEAAGSARRPAGTWLGAVLPGAAQLRAGRWRAGLAALGLWASLLAVLAWRADRVRGAWRGAADERLAVLTLAFGLAAVWLWAWRDARRGARPASGARRAGRTLRAFARDRTAMLGLCTVVALYLVALLAPLLAPFDPDRQLSLGAARYLPPSWTHPLGTDNLSRDVLSRLLYGARISLTIGFVAVALSVTIGTVLGAVAGYVGGRLDAVVMRTVDVVLAFPRLVLLITIVALFEPSVLLIVVVLGLTLWPSTTRLVRGEVLSLRERDVVVAAEALGFSRRRVVLRHLVPNALGPVIVAATLGIGDTIVLEAGLSFLGLGVQAPTASWGAMVDAGRANLLGAWWISTFPGLAIVFTVLAFNLVGDGLRDALDPRLRR